MQVEADFHAAQQALSRGFSSTVYQKNSTAWRQWRKICRWLGISSDLQVSRDPVFFLHIFVELMRTILMTSSRIPIKKRSVEQYLHSIREIFCSRQDQRPTTQQVGKDQLSPGTADGNLQESRPSTYLIPPNPCLFPPRPCHHLPIEDGKPRGNQIPSLG